MRPRNFYWRWFRVAVLHALGPIDLWSSVFGAALGTIVHLVPEWGDTVSSYLWLVPTGVAVAVVSARLIAAPYWIAREDQTKIAGLEAERIDRAKKEDMRNTIGGFINEAVAIIDRSRDQTTPPPKDDANAWFGRVLHFLENTPGLGVSYIARLNNAEVLPMMTSSIMSKEHNQLSGALRYRVARLNQFLAELAV